MHIYNMEGRGRHRIITTLCMLLVNKIRPPTDLFSIRGMGCKQNLNSLYLHGARLRSCRTKASVNIVACAACYSKHMSKGPVNWVCDRVILLCTSPSHDREHMPCVRVDSSACLLNSTAYNYPLAT